MMRWFATLSVGAVLLLVGWGMGQKASADEDLKAKFQALERRVAELEKRVTQLERQLRERRPFIVPPEWMVVPRMELERLLILRQLPERRPGFGAPKPAPDPFVQPYYYPLEKP